MVAWWERAKTRGGSSVVIELRSLELTSTAEGRGLLFGRAELFVFGVCP